MSFRRTAVLALAAVVSSSNAYPQERGLHGFVRDPLGAPVAGARVELLHDGAVVASTNSGSDGSYTLPLASSDRYTLRFSAPSFAATVRGGQRSSAGERLDLTLDTPTFTEQVTVTATGTPTPLAQSGAPITILTESEYPHSPELQQPLRLVPGLQLTQTGQTGGISELHIRGGDADANKVLIDGTPLNDIGGGVNFGNLATIGVSRIEVLRQPNSALYGSDALAGVVSFTSTRGATPLPLFTYAVDGGDYGFFHQAAELSGSQRRFDYYNGFARLNTSNSFAANAFHNATFAGNYGFAPDAKTDLRLTLRHLATNGGQPNAIALYGIPDSADQSEHDLYLSATANHQTTARWHNELQYGRERLRSQYSDYAITGLPDGSGDGLGAPVTITGANGYAVSGQALFQFAGQAPSTFNTSANRDFVYAQTDFKLNHHTSALGAFRYEDEHGSTLYATPFPPPSLATVDHGNYSYTLQIAGDAGNRLFYTLGSGIEDNAVYGKALTPRASVAYYLVRPAGQAFLSGTKLHGSFGKGLKGPTVGQENTSLYDVLQQQVPGGQTVIDNAHINPLGAEFSRTYDVGVEQQLGNGRARLNATFFHNQFTNGYEFVSEGALVALGVPKSVAETVANASFGAYVNSLAFRALGGEAEFELRLSRNLFARAGYTYLDARVQRSFSSDALSPTFNTAGNFGTVPIGVYGPLDGARPFRRAPHSGYFALDYTRRRLDAHLSGTLVSRRDDSDFLGYDSNFGQSLLLPNRNLDGSYQRLELTTDYRISSHITTYANLQNLLNEHYFEAFGYPALPFNVRGGVKFSFGGESWRLR